MLNEFPNLVQNSKFVFVPGPRDPGPAHILPRWDIQSCNLWKFLKLKLFFENHITRHKVVLVVVKQLFRVQFIFVGNFTIYFVNFYLQTFNSGVTDWRFLFKGTFSNLCYQPMSNSVLYPGGGGVSGGYCNENVPKLCSFSRRWQHSKSCKNSVFGWQWRKKKDECNLYSPNVWNKLQNIACS